MCVKVNLGIVIDWLSNLLNKLFLSKKMKDRVLRFPLTVEQVLPTSYSQSHLGAIDEWSLTEYFTLKTLFK